jgi:hypothetical protein
MQFEFAVASGAPRDLKIYATPISGQLGVYVSAMASPDPTVDASYDYQSLNFNSGEAVTISADSKMYIPLTACNCTGGALLSIMTKAIALLSTAIASHCRTMFAGTPRKASCISQ